MAIHPTAIVDSQAQVDPTAEIGPYVVIEAGARIGAGTTIGPFSQIFGETSIGDDCEIHARVSLGDIPQDRAFQNDKSFCKIGNRVIIREGVTIHRATGNGMSTIIGDNCFLMTNAHIGHNCELEKNVTMISGSLLGGHVHVGEKAIISGNAAVHQFCRIGTMAMVGGLSKITQDVPPYMMTDHFGNIVAINLVGLKRAGFNADQRREIKDAFRILYRDGFTHRHAMQILNEREFTPAINSLLDFLNETSTRGLSKWAA